MKTRNLFTALIAVVAFAFAHDVAHSGIVGYWTFENDTLDQVNNNDGAQMGGVTFSGDTPGALAGSSNSLDLAGGGFVEVANEQNFDLGGSITISTWVKGSLDGTWAPHIAKNGEGDGGFQVRKHANDQTIDWTTRRAPNNDDTDFASASSSVGDGNWRHIAATFNGVQKKIYIDGVLDNSVDVPNAWLIDSSAPVSFGATFNPGATNTDYNGLIDDTVIYDATLSAAQIAHLAAGGNPQDLPGQTTVWNFGGGDMQGWTLVNGDAHFRMDGGDDGSGITAGDGSGGFGHDIGQVANFLIASPEFQFDGSTLDGAGNALVVSFAGGQGDQDNSQSFGTPDEIINYNGGAPGENGQKGIGVLNTSTNQYDAFIYNPSDGNNDLLSFTMTDLTNLGLAADTTYQLHYFDNDAVGWGWDQLNAVHLAGGAPLAAGVPEPSTFALLGLALAGLALRRQRRNRV